VREFLGALTDAQIKQGILITLCGYTHEARQLAAKHGIELQLPRCHFTMPAISSPNPVLQPG
jgi:hypothetical protein